MVLGVRSAEKNEYINAKNDGLYWIYSYDIIEYGIKKYLSHIKKKINNKKIYLTLDIDVLDPCYAPGTGTPEPFGISPINILDFIEFFSKDIIGFDVMEVCPPYDNGESSIIAAKFIKSIIEETWLINNFKKQ
jgi:agmatinase